VGRFAPSPTGPLHLGHLQTMLLAWLQIRHAEGRFLLRIEDVDRSRTRPGATEAIVRDLAWLGFDWDEGPDVGGPAGPHVQSERLDRYEAALRTLAELTYRCTCTRAEARAAVSGPDPVSGEWPYPGLCRRGPGRPEGPASVRVRVPEGSVAWDDRVLGPCRQDPSQVCGDFILWTKSGDPAYQLAVVVDDLAMGVTEVLRGEDLLHSTARQLLLHRWLGGDAPRFAHVPLRLEEDGRKLAKSRGTPGLGLLREEGRDPRTVLGAVAHDLGLLDEPVPVEPAALLAPFAASPRWAGLRDRP
jgi:glutamyl-tRNA synthetase